jgi:nitroimidazol reductase NimA-like FMN-containing flavoprotein (pyridoxamine 5'-phosphate oxidase superfamily)
MSDYPVLPETKLRRHPERGSYDKASIHALLDEALVIHIVHLHEGVPYAIPTAFVRDGEDVILHGAVANRALGALEGSRFTLSVTLLDGLVFARSAFAHSMNYRSAVLFGEPRVLTSLDEKRRLLARLVDKVATGRSAQARPPTDAELLATAVIAVRITHASMKSREGGPRDLPGDEGFAVWTGVVPLQLRAQAAEPEARVQPEWLAPMLPDRLR